MPLAVVVVLVLLVLRKFLIPAALEVTARHQAFLARPSLMLVAGVVVVLEAALEELEAGRRAGQIQAMGR
jgi:hypothetical protein